MPPRTSCASAVRPAAAPRADLTYFVSPLLTVPLAYATIRLAGVVARVDRVLLLAGAILLSRPGHWSVLLGQTTMLLTLAAYVVLLDQSRAQLKAAADSSWP